MQLSSAASTEMQESIIALWNSRESNTLRLDHKSDWTMQQVQSINIYIINSHIFFNLKRIIESKLYFYSCHTVLTS